MTAQSVRRPRAGTGRGSGKTAAARGAPASSASLGEIALYLLQLRAKNPDRSLLYLCGNERRAEHLGAICHAFAPGCEGMVMPPPDPWQEAVISDAAGRRASVLRRLAEAPAGFVITTRDASLADVPPAKFWAKRIRRLRLGEPVEEDEIRAWLSGAGYRFEERVDTAGSASVSAQVIDIFPAGDVTPARLALEDGAIVALSNYDPVTQRVTTDRDEVVIDLVSERLIAERAAASFLDYLKTPLVLCEAEAAKQAPSAGTDKSRNMLADAVVLTATGSGSNDDIPRFVTHRSPNRALRAFLAEREKQKQRIVFTAATARDLRNLERRAGSIGKRCANWTEAAAIKPGARACLLADLDRGFVSKSPSAVVIAAADVLGSRAMRLNPMAPLSAWAAPETSIAPGDLVVHLERGVARLGSLETIETPPMPPSELVRLTFAGEASVLVPVSELDQIWRYGADSEGVSLDKADGSTWLTRRKEAEQQIAETAARLATMAAARAKATAEKLDPPPAQYERFAAGFQFIATPDQLRAVEDVLTDLGSGKPMDRLVCGDVGYGKTEVALRAAAAAIFAGKQVAIAAPTTVLVRQHVETFRKRFAPFGIEIGHLSRLAGAAETKAVRKGLADGSLRIVVGTHAITAKGVRFNDLGLLIIDEEQRFGAADKAKLAALGADMHVLTLTATPIPRTLSLASIGLRSLSVIATPPARRVPVKTIVSDFDEVTIAEALRREKRRSGQSFVVVPRIEDIAAMEARLRDLLPELDLRTIHGKMPPQTIDETMVRFADGEGDVILTTNIIESGLDLPRANTIVVWRPDRFGLAQLHQLRGRVGRGNAAAYAYFCTDPSSKLTPSAEKRLNVLADLTHSGAGFAISDRDLDIRGAGDLLGDDQAGHLKLVGPALYRRLLEQALARLRGKDDADGPDAELRLDVAALLPVSYIEDERNRLAFYERLFKARSDADIDAIEDEIEDRFGPAPDQVGNLLALARIRLLCRRLGIAQIDAGPHAIALGFTAAALRRSDNPARSLDDAEWVEGRLVVPRPSAPDRRLQVVTDLLEELE